MILDLLVTRRRSRASSGRLEFFTYLLLFLEFLTCHVICEPEVVTNKQVQPSGPKDYAYSPAGSRVKDLAAFFEAMSKQADEDFGPEVASQNVIISLSEAASKLHVLSAGYPLDIKCSKYVKLITRPNIRTFATINLLMKEAKEFNEIEQTDANLLARLSNERGFDALGKLQTLIQTLESERENMRSVFEPDVQKDILDCMNYFIYRHQRAISGVTYYARMEREKLLPLIERPAEQEIVLRKFQELMEDVSRIEAQPEEGEACDPQWINLLAKLHHLVLGNKFEVPVMVQEFVTSPKRLKRLTDCNEALDVVKDLKQQLLEMETTNKSELKTDPDYKEGLIWLNELSKSKNDILRDETLNFVQDPKRLEILQDPQVDVPNVVVPPEQDQVLEKDDSDKLLPDTSANPPSNAPQSLLDPPKLDHTYREAETVDDDEQEVDDFVPPGRADNNSSSTLHEPIDLSREVCQQLHAELNDMRLNYGKRYDLEQAKALAKSLNGFQNDCASSDLAKSLQSRWLVASMTKRLSNWSLRELKDPSPTDRDRTQVLSVLELLHPGYKP